MDRESLQNLLAALQSGDVTIDEVLERLAKLPFADLGDVKLDHHRALRQGMPEAIYGPGKTPDQCLRIVRELHSHNGGPILLTRSSEEQRTAVLDEFPSASIVGNTLVWNQASPRDANLVIVTAGTSDMPVAHEAQATLNAYGYKPSIFADCGVAGIHRLFTHLDELQRADGVIVIAGMEGALASLVGGLVACPIIAVPTSVGYGSSFEGITALLAMLSSCAPGISVVGIDNGYGAACAMARAMKHV